MKQFKIRCSSIGNIMTEPQSKADKEAGLLSKTARSEVDEYFLREKFGYNEEVFTIEIFKGILCEQDSMELVQKVLKGSFRTKHREHLENDFMTGHPDVVIDGFVEDIKTSFTIKTFLNAELSKLYEYQLRGYMALLGLDKARLIYCLVQTPEHIIAEEKKRMWFKFDCDSENEDYVSISKQIEINHNAPILILPPEKRIKVFEITRDLEIENKIYEQVKKCRAYYNSLTI